MERLSERLIDAPDETGLDHRVSLSRAMTTGFRIRLSSFDESMEGV